MHLILFIVFTGFCLAGAINLLLQSHPINSALSLIVVMVSLAVLYLLLGAEFLAAPWAFQLWWPSWASSPQ